MKSIIYIRNVYGNIANKITLLLNEHYPVYHFFLVPSNDYPEGDMIMCKENISNPVLHYLEAFASGAFHAFTMK